MQIYLFFKSSCKIVETVYLNMFNSSAIPCNICTGFAARTYLTAAMFLPCLLKIKVGRVYNRDRILSPYKKTFVELPLNNAR